MSSCSRLSLRLMFLCCVAVGAGAMAPLSLAEVVLYVASAGNNEPSFDGSSPATLMVCDTEDGHELARLSIEFQPVFDGLALAGGKVYMATVKGDILCLGGK